MKTVIKNMDRIGLVVSLVIVTMMLIGLCLAIAGVTFQ